MTYLLIGYLVLMLKYISLELILGYLSIIKKIILENLKNGKIDLLIGTHALFQKKIEFRKLGYVVIDEQHKFGVNQRSKLAKKGGNNCDVLLMSATPIPRTMMMSLYGICRNSAIKNAAAPMMGGINCPPVEATDSIAPA